MSPSWERVLKLVEILLSLVLVVCCFFAYVTGIHALPGILSLVFLDLSVLSWFIPDRTSSSLWRRQLCRIVLPGLLWVCAITYVYVYRTLPGTIPMIFLVIQTACSVIVGLSRYKWHFPAWLYLCGLYISLIGGTLLYNWGFYKLPLTCALLLLVTPIVYWARNMLIDIGLVNWLGNVFTPIHLNEEQLKQLDKIAQQVLVAIILELIGGVTIKIVLGL